MFESFRSSHNISRSTAWRRPRGTKGGYRALNIVSICSGLLRTSYSYVLCMLIVFSQFHQCTGDYIVYPLTERWWLMHKNCELEVEVLTMTICSVAASVIQDFLRTRNAQRVYIQTGRLIRVLSSLQEIAYSHMQNKKTCHN